MQMESICQNKWCKVRFFYTEDDMVLLSDGQKVCPSQCPKCRSFSDDLSGGVTWNEKRYEGSRIDGLSHPMSINVSKYTDKRRW